MNKIYRRLVKYSIVCFIFIMLVFTLQIDMIVNMSNNFINKIGYDVKESCGWFQEQVEVD